MLQKLPVFATSISKNFYLGYSSHCILKENLFCYFVEYLAIIIYLNYMENVKINLNVPKHKTKCNAIFLKMRAYFKVMN